MRYVPGLGGVEPEVAAAGFGGYAGDEAEAVAVPEGEGDHRLVAFVVAAADSADLRRRAVRALPPWLVPSRIIALEAIPLLPNGKLDREALRRIANAI